MGIAQFFFIPPSILCSHPSYSDA